MGQVMIFEIPILIEHRSDGAQGTSLYCVRPLFFETPEKRNRELSKATSRLEQQLRDELRWLASSGDHRRLSNYTFAPHVSLHWLDLQLDLKSKMERCKTVLGTFVNDGRLIAFSPYLRDVWFEIQSKANLQERARFVLTRHFRDLESRQDRAPIDRQLARLRLKKKPWLSLVELEINTQLVGQQRDQRQLAFLGGETEVDGADELRRVGRLLNSLYPDELTRAVCRNDLVRHLGGLLETAGNRPLLLVGSPLVGKTTLIHEVLFRDVKRSEECRPGAKTSCRQIWQIAPQRIITGMSFVGQWENRWLAILRHVRKRRYVLYLADLLGLFQAGVTSQSDLSAAELLKPFLERREIRLLAEMTPEQLRVLRERNRGFADIFQVLRIEESDEETALKIQLDVMRSLETRFAVRFDLEVLATVLDLAHRYQPYAAFPGKAARWLHQLAVKYKGRRVKRDDVIDEFHVKSGLQLAFVDTRGTLRRSDIVEHLQNHIIGQQEAVDAMADVISIAKARLNDPGRPLGSLFFLGPTGVGKTECSKALARYLFSDASRLLRFDMNEFVSPDAAARLVGTFDQPQGLLTAAVRHQPFCVLLFDEIEKAHPDVFDLLLQILGEARLTGSQGRTADFSNAVVILTSNLGTREASRDLGFGAGDEASSHRTYQKAVRDFFRPEFFNRLDRIVPFGRLSREEMEQIARAIIAEATGRHGLLRRKCVVDISTEALERIIDRGYDPVLGARAMRRSVERELVSPLARQLAGVQRETPTVLEVFARGGELAVEVSPLEQSQPWPETFRSSSDDLKEDAVRALSALERLSRAYEAKRPPGELLAANIGPEFAAYLGIMELTRDAKALAREIAEIVSMPRSNTTMPTMQSRPRRKRSEARLRGWKSTRHFLKELYSAEDVNEFCREIAEEVRPSSSVEEMQLAWLELLDRLALLNALVPDDNGWAGDRVLLLVRSPNATPDRRPAFTRSLLGYFSWTTGPQSSEDASHGGVAGGYGLESSHRTVVSSGTSAVEQAVIASRASSPEDIDVVVVEGYRAARLVQLHNGTHLQTARDGRMKVYQVVALPLGVGDREDEVVRDVLARDERWRNAGGPGDCETNSGPFAWKPVVTFSDSSRQLDIDFRYDRASDGGWDRLSRLLPLPPNFVTS